MAKVSRRALLGGLAALLALGMAGPLVWRWWFDTMPAALRAAVMEHPDAEYSLYRNRPFRLHPDTVICREPIEYGRVPEIAGGEAVLRRALSRFEWTMAVLPADNARCKGRRGQILVRLVVWSDRNPRLTVTLAAWQSPDGKEAGDRDALWYAVREHWGTMPMPSTLDRDAEILATQLAWKLGTEQPPPPQPEPATLARQPSPADPPGKWVTVKDYPSRELTGRVEGTVAVRLAVNEIGRVSGCSLLSSSGSALLDETSCRLLVSRARFHPARNAGGNAVTGTYVARVRWKLPEEAATSIR